MSLVPCHLMYNQRMTIARSLAMIALAPVLMGASGTTTLTTGSGSTMTGVVLTAKEADAGNAERQSQVRVFAANMKEWLLIRAAWRAFDAQEEVSAMNDRSICRADIRQANRETLLQTQVRCFRREMSTWRTRLLKQEAFISRTPGLPNSITQPLLSHSRGLREAIGVIIVALDNNVLKTEAQLVEVKRNVRAKYGLPLRTALETMRKTELKLLTQWIITMIDKTDEAETVLDRASWDAARLCMHELERPAQTMTVAAQTTALLTCLDVTRAALTKQIPPAPETGSGSVHTGTGSVVPQGQ